MFSGRTAPANCSGTHRRTAPVLIGELLRLLKIFLNFRIWLKLILVIKLLGLGDSLRMIANTKRRVKVACEKRLSVHIFCFAIKIFKCFP